MYVYIQPASNQCFISNSMWLVLCRSCSATVNEEGLLCFPTVRRRVTQGVIICDVETDMDSYHTQSQTHTPAFMHGHIVPGAQMYGSYYVCVCVCLLSYGWVAPPSHGLSEYSQHVGTVHNTVRPCRPLPCLPVPSDLDRGQSSRPSKQYTARPWKTTVAPQCIPLISLGTPVFVQSLWSRRDAVWRDY